MLYKNTQFETVYTFEVIFDQPPTDCKSINKKADWFRLKITVTVH